MEKRGEEPLMNANERERERGETEPLMDADER
jgi:hypothetical protein